MHRSRAAIVPGMALVLALGVAAAGIAQGQYAKEDKSPTGKFLTASEVRPILEATRGNWIAVRAYNGQDLLYFRHLLSWRCGLHEIRFSINDGPMQVFAHPPCDAQAPAPAAIPDDATIYLSYPLGSVQAVDIELLYDDLEVAEGAFLRKAIQIN
ncbi:MAG: hypothetical protein OQK00_01120 [Rhodobacteraceae bacterium]|nr:hypothetical protein [Paracoccaceae bacterium]